MAEYIKRDSLLEFLDHKMEAYFTVSPIFSFGLSEVIDKVRKMPAEDVQPVIKGRWVDGDLVGIGALNIEYHEQKCSVCGYSHAFPRIHNYCPHCGARMDGVG